MIEDASSYVGYNHGHELYDETWHHNKEDFLRTIVKSIEPYLENNWKCETK